ncbi:MAG: hypothetical protein M3P18_12995, partial [Actinomycetota bacterium]|nr:hypothetical protein [Actinomycetota bacterium]
SIAPASSWPSISKTFRDWAAASGFVGVVTCEHVPGSLLLQAANPQSPTLTELDVLAECYWRGDRLLAAADLAPLMLEDPRGFRRLREGAEGLLLLLLNGIRWAGAPRSQVIRNKHIATLMDSDPDGMRTAAEILGSAAPTAVRLAEALKRGEWNRALAVRLEIRALARGLAAPMSLARRASFRGGAFRTCPVISLTRTGRKTPPNIEEWLSLMSKSHSVIGL